MGEMFLVLAVERQPQATHQQTPWQGNQEEGISLRRSRRGADGAQAMQRGERMDPRHAV